ncbi:hypothetical protein SCLCIDRAFT_1216026 [Scleroderma citrinum Foug A]|uniref:Uncharacterized protein n=1 Tax=Scleroderma citrinum Foug A TaxID=1036808 RepID=A0A0C3A9I5_9AGAM|nr:hypothetical protein SCLCIDRAFT_1216026 [Scleroderma citrinum Foug A]
MKLMTAGYLTLRLTGPPKNTSASGLSRCPEYGPMQIGAAILSEEEKLKHKLEP